MLQVLSILNFTVPVLEMFSKNMQTKHRKYKYATKSPIDGPRWWRRAQETSCITPYLNPSDSHCMYNKIQTLTSLHDLATAYLSHLIPYSSSLCPLCSSRFFLFLEHNKYVSISDPLFLLFLLPEFYFPLALFMALISD